MRTSDLTVPRNFDEFYRDWDGFIDGAIEKVSKGNVKRGTDEANDAKQTVYLRILQTGHLEKYDPVKGSFSHFIYRVVLHTLSNTWERNVRTPTAAVNSVHAIETHSDDPADAGAFVLEAFADQRAETEDRRRELADFWDRFHSYLEQESAAWGPKLQHPLVSGRQKSLALVFELLRKDLEPKEIASALGVTGSSVFGYIKKIQGFATKFGQAMLV